jgi:hypothetical protein
MNETGEDQKVSKQVSRARGREAWPKNRPERMSLGERGSLTYDPKLLQDLKNQGLTPRLVSDDPGRIDTFLRRGWKFIQDDGQIGDERAAQPGKLGGNAVKHVGSGKSGYLMAVPTEWYEEDQRKKASAVDASEAAMKAPKKGAKLKDGEVGEAYGPGLTND